MRTCMEAMLDGAAWFCQQGRMIPVIGYDAVALGVIR